MIRDTQSTTDSSSVHEHVARIHHAKQRLSLKTVLLAGLAILAIGMVIAMIVDARLNLFSHAVRWLLTIGAIAISAVCMWLLFVRSRLHNQRRVSAAQDIDTTYPVLQERVTTLTSCEEDFGGSQRLVHPAMLRKVSEETAAMHRSVEPRPIVSRRPLIAPLLGIGFAALILLGMLVFDPPKTLVQLARFWAPWSDLSVTQVEPTKGDHVTARGEPLTLTASLSGRPVEEVFVKMRAADRSSSASERVWPSTKDRTLAHYRQPSAKESFDYRFRAGDGQTDWHRVTVADRPKIDELVLRITPPAYTGRSAQEFRRLPKKMRTVVGSKMEVVLKPLAPIRTARVVTGKTDWLPMEQSKDATYQCSADLVNDLQFEVQLTERYGLQNRRPPRCFLQVVPDKAPKVRILKPTADALVLPDETIDIHYQATDDFAVESMELRVYAHREGESEPSVHALNIPIKPEQNRKKIKGVVQLDLDQFKLKDGDSISYELVARDNYAEQADPGELANAKPIRQSPDKPGNSSDSSEKPNKQGDATRQDDASQAIAANGANEASENKQNERNKSPAFANPGDSSTNSNARTSESKDVRPQSSQPSKPNQTDRDASLADNDGKPSSANRQSPSTNSQQPSQQSQGNQSKSMANKDAKSQNGSPSSPKKTVANASPTGNQGNDQKNDKDSPQKPGQSDRQKMTAQKMNESSQQNDSATPSQPSESANTNRSAAQNNTNNSSSKPSGQSAVKPLPAQRDEDSGDGPWENDNPDKKDREKPANESDDSEKDSEGKSSSAEPVEMVMRKLDVGQSSSSGQRKMKVDSHVGGYETEKRIKLEIAIAPKLAKLKASLTRAGKYTRGVLKDREEGKAFADRHDRALSSAANELKTASDSVLSLNRKTAGTPYAFIGLKLESIRLADVAPADTNVRDALRTEGNDRQNHVSIASHHISRALASLEELTDEFEEVKREHKLADKMIKFKKMHRVFIENAMATLAKPPGALNKQQREGAEFDLDEEYLKRLQEVLEMRRDMMAELARILSDDPQLLRRYMNSIKSRSRTIRDQLTLLARAQTAISERVSSWAIASTGSPETDLESVEYSIIATAHLASVRDLSNELADISDRFSSWLPLEEDVERGDVATALELSKIAGSKLTEMATGVDAIRASGGLQGDYQSQLAPLVPKAAAAKQSLKRMDQMLRRIADDARRPELVNNALRRLKELREFRFRFEQWNGKTELFAEGKANEVLSIDQENARDDLLEYVVKIAGLESQLGSMLQGGLPAPVAQKTKALLTLIDVDLPALQLTAAQSLRDNDQVESKQQQSKLVADYESAQVLFDEILQAIADELDKLPPGDPIASLLRDPTLDEILAQLENEQDFLEELGMTARPSNLQIIGDWMRNSGSGGGGGGNSGASVSAMLRRMMREQQMARRLSNRAARNALKEAKVKNSNQRNQTAKEDRRWNLLMGQLREDMLQGDNKVPPERYRKAINEYFRNISKLQEDAE